jgi:hypothetical protein
MKEIGNLWYKRDITVDKEHYATAFTQGVMSSFIPEYFQLPEMEKLWLHYV